MSPVVPQAEFVATGVFMRRIGWYSRGVVLLTGLCTVPSWVVAADQSPAEILREIDAIGREDGDPARDGDRAYAAQFWKRQHERFTRRAELIGDLYRVDPGNPRVVSLMPVRWRALSGRLMGATGNEDVAGLLAEVDRVFAASKDERLKIEAAHVQAWILSDFQNRPGAAPDIASKMKAVDHFIAFAPQDERGAELLYWLTRNFPEDPAQQQPIYRRIVREYPTTRQAATARGLISKADAVGKPFDLTFRDATTGAEVATGSMRGRVIVVDFWATWCDPCVADLPRLKNLYAKYHPRGVEFLGVSLDNPLPAGGIEKFRTFLGKNTISWPQFFEGDGFDSPFSTAAGIVVVPTLYVVDRQGQIVSVNAGDQLEMLIQAELDRKAPEAPGSGGR